MTNLAAWIVVGVAAVAAVALFVRARALAVELADSGVDNEKLRGELQASRQQLERAQAKQRRGSEELGELRKKLEKTRKRAARAQDSGKGATASQVQDLESELEQTRQARDAAREEATGLSAELSRVRAEVAKARARPVVEAPAPAPDESAIDALRKRTEEAEAAVASARSELETLDRSNTRLKGRIDTQERLYVSIRSELEAKKDRLRTQQEEIERLQALKVALVDPLPAESAVANDPADSAAPDLPSDESSEPS